MIKTSLLLLIQFLALTVTANVVPASIFKDHMVLQRNTNVVIWGKADAGEKITVTFNKQKKLAITNENGEWKLRLAKLSAGGPFNMIIAGKNRVSLNDIYVGEVWLCSGQSNMDMTVAREDRGWAGVFNEKAEVEAANYPTIRVFDVDFTPNEKLQDKVTGKWEAVSPQTVGHLSAAAYFFARELQGKLKVPIGLITTAYGASTAEAWIRKEALQANPKFSYLLDSFQNKLQRFYTDTAAQSKYKQSLAKWKADSAKAATEGRDELKPLRTPGPASDQHNPYVLWNGMVAPLVPFTIKGALWYQGESNGPSANIYREIMETLVSDWRMQWGQGNFPFIYVQLANHQKLVAEPVKDDPMVTVRDAQLKNLSIPNTAMVVAIDNADSTNPGNIHPKNKQEIGRRLALAALAIAYGKKIVYSGPLYKKMVVEGNKARLYFNDANAGLMVKGEKPTGFAIAGADKKFVWADAVVDGKTILVSSPQVNKPVAVRYGWAKNPPVNLFNNARLPASPFKTD